MGVGVNVGVGVFVGTPVGVGGGVFVGVGVIVGGLLQENCSVWVKADQTLQLIHGE